MSAIPEVVDAKYAKTLRKYPWRLRVTPFDDIISYPYKGDGTDENPYIIDWLPEDPEDPQRWPEYSKWLQIAMSSMATLAVTMSSSCYSGGIPSLMKEFGNSQLFWTSGISFFVLGFAFGPLFWAPASEVFGRRIIYVISFFFLTLWQAVAVASPNPGSYLVFRFLSGFFGSSPLANGGGTIADVLDERQIGLGMALFALAPFLGPAIGPISGGFLGQAGGWRWVQGLLAIFCFIIFLWLLFGASETYGPYILRRRAAKLSRATGRVYRYRADAARKFSVRRLFQASLTRPWKFLIFEPIVLLLSIYVAIVYGVLYMNFAAYPIVFGKKGWSLGVSGLAFLGILVGAVISVIITVVWTNPAYIRTIKKRGYPLPEDRLPPAIYAGVVMVIGLAGFAATDGPNVHWIAPIIFGAPFGAGMVVFFLAVMSYLVDTYVVYAASVLAANAVLRSLFGAGFPLFTKAMYNNLGVHWAAAVPGFLALACLPFPWFFYKYGAQLRAKCKYASEAAKIYQQILDARKANMANNGGDSEKDGRVNSAVSQEEQREEDALHNPELYDLERSLSMEDELHDPRSAPNSLYSTRSRLSDPGRSHGGGFFGGRSKA